MNKLTITLFLMMTFVASTTQAQEMFVVKASVTKEVVSSWYNPVSWWGNDDTITSLVTIGKAGQPLPFKSLKEITYLIDIEVEGQNGITKESKISKDGLEMSVLAIPVIRNNEDKIHTSVTYSYSVSEETDSMMRDQFTYHSHSQWITKPGKMQRFPFTLRGDEYTLNVTVSPYEEKVADL